MDVKHKKYGFTMVELLTVLAIMAMLVGLLVPTLNMVRNTAKEAKQKAQLSAIEMALMAFRNDFGDYPPSDWDPKYSLDYCGAQKLAEALLGWDLMGFHPQSKWDAIGSVYNSSVDNLKQRRGPYLEVATASAFRLGDLLDDTGPLDGRRFVLCDSFGAKKISLPVPTTGDTVTYKAGTPILYYKANTSSKTIEAPFSGERIYDARNNRELVDPGRIVDGKPHPLGFEQGADYPVFYNYRYDYDMGPGNRGSGYGIVDPKITGRKWPHRPDSYILITAGADGLYGTGDDICNF